MVLYNLIDFVSYILICSFDRTPILYNLVSEPSFAMPIASECWINLLICAFVYSLSRFVAINNLFTSWMLPVLYRKTSFTFSSSAVRASNSCKLDISESLKK